MSRKIKINTVSTTDLENTLNKNLCRKPVTISGPEKTIVVSDNTHRSEEEFKAQLERDREDRKEIRKTINDSKKVVEKIRDAKVNNNVPDILKGPINIGDANADTNNTSETLCQDILKRYPHLKEKTSSILANIDNDPLEENKENRILVATDSDNKDIEYARKLIKENIIPRINELNRLEEETRKIQNLPLDVTKPYEEVNHPDHYNVYDVEVVEMMERIFGIEETMSWCKLNAFKYRMRAGEKPTSTVEKDLKKEKWCLNKYKELKSKK